MNRNPFPFFDPYAKRRAAEGLPPLADTAALRHTRCQNFDNSSQPQTTSTASTQTDARVTATDNARLFNLADSKIESGGVVNFTMSSDEVANNAINAVAALGAQVANVSAALGGRVADVSASSARALAAGSNEIASVVAKSQEQFVATASGQKNVMYVLLAGVAMLVIVPRLFQNK